MRIANKTEFLVLAKTERPNSNGGSYYRLICMQNGEVFESNVSMEVFNAVKEQTSYVFITEYASGRSQNGDYQYFRITGLANASNVKQS